MKLELQETWLDTEKLFLEYVTLWSVFKEYSEGLRKSLFLKSFI